MRTSADINAEIFNLGPRFFEAVRRDVRARATVAGTPAVAAANRQRLDEQVAAVLDEARPRERDHDAMWQILWGRIAYAGTKAAKATQEIASMRALIPLFQHLDHYDPGRYVFDKQEWQHFVAHWRARAGATRLASDWLARAKASPHWNPQAAFADGKTTPEVWRILVKDDHTYPGLKFSALSAKVEKYLAVAKFLHEHRTQGGTRPLDHYLGGATFDPGHLTGAAWVEERRLLATVRQRFERQLGALTALHTMMDLGLKTIKPDRVMTYLFSQLGWLQTLPVSLGKEQVLSTYLHSDVIDEMTVRADVLAASLDRAGHELTHRLLDIWIVKYGQDPDPEWGITVNLQEAGSGIAALLREAQPFAAGPLTTQQAAELWPVREYGPVPSKSSPTGDPAAKSRGSRRTATAARKPRIEVPRDVAETRFVEQWVAGHRDRPDVYPGRNPGIPNDQKEEIIRKIQGGMAPAEAFLSTLLRGPIE